MADAFAVPACGVRLAAARAWEVSGALAAAGAAAFVSRPGTVPGPLADQPDIVGDLGEVADSIIAIDRRAAAAGDP